MNKVYRTIDEIHMDGEKKREIRANLMKEYEEMEGFHMRRKSKIALAWKTAAAVLGVVAVLGGTSAIAGAVFGFDVNRDFERFFGMSEKEDQKLHEEKVIQAPNISDTHNGYTVEVEKLISTGSECMIWLKTIAPEDTWPLKDPVTFGYFDDSSNKVVDGFDFYQNGKRVKSRGVSYVYKEMGQTPDDSADSDKPWSSIVWHPEQGITYHQIELSTAEGEESWDGSTLQIKLRYPSSNEKVIDADSVWNLEIPVENSDKAVEHKIQYDYPISDKRSLQEGVNKLTITKVTLHPFAITLEFECPDQWKNDPDCWTHVDRIKGYECKDGSVVKFETQKGTYNEVEIKDNGSCEASETYYKPIDIDNITAIYLGKERIPLE